MLHVTCTSTFFFDCVTYLGIPIGIGIIELSSWETEGCAPLPWGC